MCGGQFLFRLPREQQKYSLHSSFIFCDRTLLVDSKYPTDIAEFIRMVPAFSGHLFTEVANKTPSTHMTEKLIKCLKLNLNNDSACSNVRNGTIIANE